MASPSGCSSNAGSKRGVFVHSYYVSTLFSLPSKGLFIAQYDARGEAEVEQFRSDKSGLGLEARRKRSFLGQKGYILLTDLAHDVLSDFQHRALVGTPFAGFGPKRIVRDCSPYQGGSFLTVVNWFESIC